MNSDSANDLLAALKEMLAARTASQEAGNRAFQAENQLRDAMRHHEVEVIVIDTGQDAVGIAYTGGRIEEKRTKIFKLPGEPCAT